MAGPVTDSKPEGVWISPVDEGIISKEAISIEADIGGVDWPDEYGAWRTFKIGAGTRCDIFDTFPEFFGASVTDGENKRGLASYAMPVGKTLGRRYAELSHPYRNEYERDRDRIIHSRAFRRLENKTQVFTRRYSDHFRNRLTHTLEVAQISRTVAKALRLNGDLVEALALVHDVGHPPFGHAGERSLDRLMEAQGERFDHNLHALRIVEQFEQKYVNFPGLNLTFEV